MFRPAVPMSRIAIRTWFRPHSCVIGLRPARPNRRRGGVRQAAKSHRLISTGLQAGVFASSTNEASRFGGLYLSSERSHRQRGKAVQTARAVYVLSFGLKAGESITPPLQRCYIQRAQDRSAAESRQIPALLSPRTTAMTSRPGLAALEIKQ